MLSSLLGFFAILAVAVAIDWSTCTRAVAYRTDYEYSYRPAVVRSATLFLVAVLASYMQATYDPERQPIAGLLASIALLSAWAYFALKDVERRLVPTDLAPKRHADSDY